MIENERLYCVYIHINKHNNKKYIGITCRPVEVRWNNGKGYIQNKHFWNAIQKIGWDNFEHLVVASGLLKVAAHKLERFLIKSYNTTDPAFGYNHSIGGEGGARYLTEAEKTTARKQTLKKRYAQLKQDETKYKQYLESNNTIHKTAYNDPVKNKRIRSRLNACKQKYRQNPEFLKKDREATNKVRAEVKQLRAQLLELIKEFPDKFTLEEVELITARRKSNGDYVCQSKLKLQKILENITETI